MIRAAIIGGSGYTGLELIRLVLRHPAVELVAICSRTHAGSKLSDVFPSFIGGSEIYFDAELGHDCDIVFFATPNGVAMKQVSALLNEGKKVIDLSADFRLRDISVWEHWYKTKHACPQLLLKAVYGLPEVYRTVIKQSQLIANPGCYPTAVLLACYPLVKEEAIQNSFLIADAKSGVSGAGRREDVGLIFSEISDSFKAYKVTAHRHFPEIMSQLQAFGKDHLFADDLTFSFTPHLAPMNRGIFVTLYFTSEYTQAELQCIFEDYYVNEPFVRVLPLGSHPQTHDVRATNYCHIAVHRSVESPIAKVLVVIDNLVKGAAGQAVQNMNLLFEQKETAGLQAIAPLP